MRRRRHQRDGLVLVASVVLSLLLHVLPATQLRGVLNRLLAGAPRQGPVRLVQIPRQQWQGQMSEAKRIAERRAARSVQSERAKIARAEAAKPEPKPEETRLNGQIVEVPPTADDRPNPSAKYLSRYNAHVEKETVARPDARDPSLKRVTNRLQRKSEGAPPENAMLTPGLISEGKGAGPQSPKQAAQAEKKAGTGQRFVLEVPDLRQQDPVRLKLDEGSGLRLNNRTASETMPGNSNRFRVETGEGEQSPNVPAAGGAKGEMDGLPTLSALVPPPGRRGTLDGSPSRDHVEGLPEGDGTFLNTKEFKYATFFYRVRDSVAAHWEDLAMQEYRRRDPTGSIYGSRDRATMLQVRLRRDGGLDGVVVKETSDVPFLDDVAVRAFQLAQPFPNPPQGILDEDGYIRFNFQFVVTMRSQSVLNLFNSR